MSFLPLSTGIKTTLLLKMLQVFSIQEIGTYCWPFQNTPVLFCNNFWELLEVVIVLLEDPRPVVEMQFSNIGNYCVPQNFTTSFPQSKHRVPEAAKQPQIIFESPAYLTIWRALVFKVFFFKTILWRHVLFSHFTVRFPKRTIGLPQNSVFIPVCISIGGSLGLLGVSFYWDGDR